MCFVIFTSQLRQLPTTSRRHFASHFAFYQFATSQFALRVLPTPDLIEVFKIIKGFDKVNYLEFFHLSTTGLRGHNLELFKPSFNRNVGKYTFSNRVIDSWNRLPENIIACESLDNFKKKLDRLFKFCCG